MPDEMLNDSVEITVGGASAADVEALQAALRAEGLVVPETYGVFIREDAYGWQGPALIILGIVLDRGLGPTAEVIVGPASRQLRARVEALVRVINKHLETATATYQIEVKSGDRVVARYWIPNDEDHAAALATVLDDYDLRMGQNPSRHWWKGEGWVTDDEIANRGRKS
jgi:hypothetical protein